MYQSAIEEAQNKATVAPVVKLATVTSLDSSNRAHVKFYGDNAASSKLYPYVAGYVPVVGDVVAMLAQADTFIIIGKVTTDAVTASVYLTKAQADGYYAASEHEHSQIKNGSYSLSVGSSGVVPGGNGYNLGSSGATFNRGFFDRICAPQWAYAYNSTNYLEWSNSLLLLPSITKQITLGSMQRQFHNVYAEQFYQNGSAISTSDKRAKKNIKGIAKKYVEFFKKLRPVTYKMKKGDSGRLHAGFIAQEVEEAMRQCDISNMEFAGLVIDPEGNYGLRYEEFIAIQTAVIQNLMSRVEALENKIKEGKS